MTNDQNKKATSHEEEKKDNSIKEQGSLIDEKQNDKGDAISLTDQTMAGAVNNITPSSPSKEE